MNVTLVIFIILHPTAALQRIDLCHSLRRQVSHCGDLVQTMYRSRFHGMNILRLPREQYWIIPDVSVIILVAFPTCMDLASDKMVLRSSHTDRLLDSMPDVLQAYVHRWHLRFPRASIRLKQDLRRCSTSRHWPAESDAARCRRSRYYIVQIVQMRARAHPRRLVEIW